MKYIYAEFMFIDETAHKIEDYPSEMWIQMWDQNMNSTYSTNSAKLLVIFDEMV